VETLIGCQYGIRRKDGKQVRGPTCTNRAHGIWRVYPKRGKPYARILCAECGFDKMPNHLRYLPPADDNSPPMWYRDIERVVLVITLSTEFDQTSVEPSRGSKHWVEPTHKPAREAFIYKRIIRHNAVTEKMGTMDMTAYLQSLEDHQ
jgi:hypothetical protein